MNYTIEVDTGRKRSTRVRFQDNPNDIFTRSLSLPSSKSKCQTVKLNVVVGFKLFYRIKVPQYPCVTNEIRTENLESFLQTPVMDKLKPVDFSLSVSLSEPKPKSRRSLQNLDSYPILSHDQKLSEITEVTLTVN